MGRIHTLPTGQRIHIGGRVAPATPHRLKLHDPRYALNLASWPATPSSTSYGSAPAAQACLGDILGNDKLGDCTEADQYHRQALRQAAAGASVFHPPLDVVVWTYSRDGGYVAGDPSTDQGCDETVVLTNARNLGIKSGSGVYQSSGFVAIDGSNRDLVRAAVSMFVGAPICAALDQRWIDAAAPGATWAVPPGGYVAVPSNGHCFTLADQTEHDLGIWSWAMPLRLTYDALAAATSAANGGALYIEVDADILAAASQSAPDALDWAALQADFALLSTPVVTPPSTVPPIGPGGGGGPLGPAAG